MEKSLKVSGKSVYGVPLWSTCILKHGARVINKWALYLGTFSGLWSCWDNRDKMTSLSEMFQWRVTHFIGKTDQQDKDGEFPFMWEGIWGEWNTAWSSTESQQNLWMKIKKKASKSDIVECLCCRPPSEEEKEASTDRKQTYSQDQILTGGFNYLYVY